MRVEPHATSQPAPPQPARTLAATERPQLYCAQITFSASCCMSKGLNFFFGGKATQTDECPSPHSSPPMPPPPSPPLPPSPPPPPPPPPLQPDELWGPFEIVIKETFTSTLNCLVDCDANPTVPEIETQDDTGSIAIIGGKQLGDPAGDTPDTAVLILTSGKEYEYDTPPLASSVCMQHDTPTLPEANKHLVTSVTMADIDDDCDMDVIVEPNGPNKPGVTKVYLNLGGNNFTGITPIEIEAPDKDTTDGEAPVTTDAVVGDIISDRYPDMVTVNDADDENVLYFWGPTGPQQLGKSLGTDLKYQAPSETYTGTDTDIDPHVIAERTSPSQSVQVVDVNSDGRADIIVASFSNPNPNDPAIDTTPNVVYFQDGVGNYPTATKLAPSSRKDDQGFSKTTKIVVADVDGDDKMDLVVANCDQENQIFLAKDATEGVLKETTLTTATPSTDSALLDSFERSPSKTTRIVVTNVDGDGEMHLVVTNRDQETRSSWPRTRPLVSWTKPA